MPKAKGVILKGDIPIGVNRNGCDVWMGTKISTQWSGRVLHLMTLCQQNWGFPTYNWFEMLKDVTACGGTAVSRTWQDILMLTASTTYWVSSVSGRFRYSVHGLLGQFAPALRYEP